MIDALLIKSAGGEKSWWIPRLLGSFFVKLFIRSMLQIQALHAQKLFSMITVFHLAMTRADAVFSIFSFSPSGTCRDARVTDFIIFLAVP